VSTARDLRGYSGVNLVFDLLVPLGLYYGLRAAGVGVYLTLIISAAVPAVVVAYRLLSEQRVDGPALYVLTTMALGTGASLFTGSVQLLLAKEGWLTGISALWFLASVRGRRPLTFLFSRPLLEGRRVMPPRILGQLWQTLPRFRRIWRISSLMWGFGLLADSVIRVAMAYTLPADLVPALGTALYIGTSLVLIVATNIYYIFAGLYDGRSPLYAPLVPAPSSPEALVTEVVKP
jgi:hypothetical protein